MWQQLVNDAIRCGKTGGFADALWFTTFCSTPAAGLSTFRSDKPCRDPRASFTTEKSPFYITINEARTSDNISSTLVSTDRRWRPLFDQASPYDIKGPSSWDVSVPTGYKPRCALAYQKIRNSRPGSGDHTPFNEPLPRRWLGLSPTSSPGSERARE